MIIFRKRFAFVSLLVAVVSLVGGLPTDAAANGTDAKGPYSAHVRWTSFGIPHVRASNWGGLGYGYGYAFARDNVCTLAERRGGVEWPALPLLRFRRRQPRRATSCGRCSTRTRRPRRTSQKLDGDMQELLRGYAAGYNRYLRDTGVSKRWRSPAVTRSG